MRAVARQNPVALKLKRLNNDHPDSHQIDANVSTTSNSSVTKIELRYRSGITGLNDLYLSGSFQAPN